MYRSLLLAALLLLGWVAPAGAQTAQGQRGDGLARLLRFPDIHGDTVAFVYAGDIWPAPASGGAARRLTSHPGLELFPKFSPDGRWIAFSGEYAGTRQVFVISAEGGEPRQLTFYNDVAALPPRGGFDNRVLGWTPDGKNVLFRANRVPWSDRMGRPYLVPVAGGMETAAGDSRKAGGVSYSPDGTQIAYTPIERVPGVEALSRRAVAQDVWIYDLEGATRSEQITNTRAHGQAARLDRRHRSTSLRPRVDDEPLRLRHADEADAQGDEPLGLRRALAELRLTATGRLRERRLRLSPRHATRQRGARPHHASTATSPTRVPYFKNVKANIETYSHLAERRARALRRARRHLHRAREGGRDAQPHQTRGRARDDARLVARRHAGSRTSPTAPASTRSTCARGRHGRGAAGHDATATSGASRPSGRPTVALLALRRQEAAPALSSRWRRAATTGG